MRETLAAEAFDSRTAMTFTLAFVRAVTHLSFGERVAADNTGGSRIVIVLLHHRGMIWPFGETEAGEKRAVDESADGLILFPSMLFE